MPLPPVGIDRDVMGMQENHAHLAKEERLQPSGPYLKKPLHLLCNSNPMGPQANLIPTLHLLRRASLSFFRLPMSAREAAQEQTIQIAMQFKDFTLDLFGVKMPCGLPTRRYFQVIYLVWKCPAGCQPAGTFKPFIWCENALRAANPHVLSSHLFGVQMPCGLPTRRYFQAIYLVFKCPAGCQPAGTFKPFIWCSNALRAANPQVLSSHLFGVQMPCGLPTRR